MSAFSTHISRSVSLPAQTPRPQHRLRAVLDDLGYRRAACSGSEKRRTRGSLLSLNPNQIRHALTWTSCPSEGLLRLSVRAPCLPWTRARTTRLLGRTLDRIAEGIQDPPPAGTGHRERFLLVPRFRDPGFFPSLGSVLVSLLLATLLACLVHLVFGHGLVRETLETLRAKSALLGGAAALPLPPEEMLRGLPGSFLWTCALFFAVPLGIFTGVAGSLLLLLGEAWRPAGRIALPLLVVLGLSLGAYGFRAESAPLDLACTALLPLSVYIGYSLGWGLRGASLSRTPLHARKAVMLVVTLFLLARGGAVLKDPKTAASAKDRGLAFVEFRDRHLLTRTIGRRLTQMYYTHTLYPAEAIKPRNRKDPKAVLFCGVDGKRQEALSGFLGRRHGVLLHVATPDDLSDLLELEGVDFLFLDLEDGKVREALLQTIRAGAPDACLDAAIFFGRPERIAGFAEHLPERLGPALVPLPLSDSALAAALATASERLDRQGNLRRLLRWALPGTLAILWVSATLGRALLVLAPALTALHAEARLRQAPRRVPRFLLPCAGMLLSGILGYSLYVPSWSQRQVLELRSPLAAGMGTAVPVLCGALAHPEAGVRYEAAYGLWQQARQSRLPSDCASSVVRGIADPDPRVRAWCALLLGETGGADSQGALIRALEDPALFVRSKAATALGRIGDRDALRAVDRRVQEETAWYVRPHLLSARGLLQRRQHETPVPTTTRTSPAD